MGGEGGNEQQQRRCSGISEIKKRRGNQAETTRPVTRECIGEEYKVFLVFLHLGTMNYMNIT